MADKRISQLIERTDIANNDVLPIVASGATTTNKVTISTIQEWMQDNLDVGVTSVGITLGSSGTDVNVTGSPITTSGNITINIPTASATNRGLLSSADWATFNSKAPAGNYVTTDTTQTITGEKTFTATNTNINGSIVLKSSALTGLVVSSYSPNALEIGATISGTIYYSSFVFPAGARSWNLPDASGTLALTSDLSGYVTLGTAQTITAQKTIQTNSGSDTFIVNHTSGNGVAVNITKGGNNEALKVTKTSGSGSAVTISGGLLSAEAATLTGALNGTTASFSGRVTVGGGGSNNLSVVANNGSVTIDQNSLSLSTGFNVGYLHNYQNGVLRDLYYNANNHLFNNNVGIGTASPASKLHIGGVGSALAFDTTGGANSIKIRTVEDFKLSLFCERGTTSEIKVGNENLEFFTSNTERMRITSGGALQMSNNSTTFSIGSISGQNRIQWDSTEFAFLNTANSYTALGASAFNTRSDYRLKENVAPVQDALSKITSLKPCTFNFIAEPEKEVVGFIAHEVQEVFPQAISGEKDGFRIEQVEVSPAELDEEGNVITEAVIEEKEVPVYQGIDHSKLVPLLVAAIQEQQEQIKSLTEQVEALKSQING